MKSETERETNVSYAATAATTATAATSGLPGVQTWDGGVNTCDPIGYRPDHRMIRYKITKMQQIPGENKFEEPRNTYSTETLRPRKGRLSSRNSRKSPLTPLEPTYRAEILTNCNVDREVYASLDMFGQAVWIVALMQKTGFSQRNVADYLCVSQSAVGNKIRLLHYSTPERDYILQNHLSERHARAVLRLGLPIERKKMLKTVSDQALSVAKTEEMVEKWLSSVPQMFQTEKPKKTASERVPQKQMEDSDRVDRLPFALLRFFPLLSPGPKIDLICGRCADPMRYFYATGENAARIAPDSLYPEPNLPQKAAFAIQIALSQGKRSTLPRCNGAQTTVYMLLSAQNSADPMQSGRRFSADYCNECKKSGRIRLVIAIFSQNHNYVKSPTCLRL